MKHLIFSALLGLALGGIIALAIGRGEPAPAPEPGRQPLGRQPTGARLSAPPAPKAPSGQSLDKQRAEAQAGKTFNPHRARLISADLVESLSTDQIIDALRAGQIHRNEEVRLAFTRVADLDPLLALDLLELLPRGNEFNTAQEAAMSAWTARDPQAVLAYVSDLPTRELRSGLVTRLAHEWAKADPAAAMARLAEIESLLMSYSRQSLAGSLLATWAETDPAAAEEWIENEAPPGRRDSLREALLVGRMQSMPNAERVDFILDRGDVPALQAKLSEAFQTWAMFEPAAALDRLVTIPPDHAIWRQGEALGSAAMQNVTMNNDDLASLRELRDKLPDGEAQRQFLLGAANAASSNGLDTAIEIIAQIPESREREQAVGMFTELSMRKDPVALSEWLSNLEPSPSRDVAVSRFVSLLAKSDPDRARLWAETVADERERGRLQELVARGRGQLEGQ